MNCDINCDLGEGEPASRRRALLHSVTSVNIACGGHAGDVASMRLCVRDALEYRVRVGAHPALNDRENFGRSATAITPHALELLLLQQIAALEKIARAESATVHHVKLHGALYHLTESDARLRATYLSMIKTFWPKLRIFARAGGRVIADAKTARLEAWPEGFLDRGYLQDGSLVPRTEANAILTPSEFTRRLARIARGELPAAAEVRTWCIHSDTPGSVKIAQLAKRELTSGQ